MHATSPSNTSSEEIWQDPSGKADTGTAGRLVSLDAFRGAVMLLMASTGFGIPQVAKHFPQSAVWAFFGYEFDHPPWVGFTLWDIIQPAFMFMVGVAVPWSVANRQTRGEQFPSMFRHALWRALLLVLLSIFLQSTWSRSTDWSFNNVLAQIGLGYPVLFLLAFKPPRVQWLAAGGILFVWWLLFAIYPLPPPGILYADPHHTAVFADHWTKGWNPAARFDLWFLNLFPCDKPYVANEGGYQTLNFIPSLATMIFGLIAGRLLRSDLDTREKLIGLAKAGLAWITLGSAIHLMGLCPIVKRIWTPSWALVSAGLVSLLLAAFVAVIDWKGKRQWAFPLIVAGLNPITLYVMWQIMAGGVRGRIRIHFGQHVFESFGTTYAPILERCSVLLAFWLILYWMYRQRIFIRI